MPRNKELIIEPAVPKDRLNDFLEKSLKLGIRSFYAEDTSLERFCDEAKIIAPSDAGAIRLLFSIDELVAVKETTKPKALLLTLKEKKDLDLAVEAIRKGVDYLIIDAPDWKIIPLENLIAEARERQGKLIAKTEDVEEIKTLLGVLEVGVDGIVLKAKKIDEVSQALKTLTPFIGIKLVSARIVEVKAVGLGERACVDTSSLLKVGEGMLIGSAASFLFLVHNESTGSRFTSPRPFRVNAGGIHSYILMADGKTKYLSELEAGDTVLIVDDKGSVKEAVVGRVKIERRPLKLVKAEYEDERGSILVQDAETIGLVGPEGKVISVNELKPGDEVLVKVEAVKGRHFGTEVDEFVIER
ncbi:MAG: 3-dehydroquinate synthase II [Nitrososphaerota archaeon]